MEASFTHPWKIGFLQHSYPPASLKGQHYEDSLQLANNSFHRPCHFSLYWVLCLALSLSPHSKAEMITCNFSNFSRSKQNPLSHEVDGVEMWLWTDDFKAKRKKICKTIVQIWWGWSLNLALGSANLGPKGGSHDSTFKGWQASAAIVTVFCETFKNQKWQWAVGWMKGDSIPLVKKM